jgi:hypothetical protein
MLTLTDYLLKTNAFEIYTFSYKYKEHDIGKLHNYDIYLLPVMSLFITLTIFFFIFRRVKFGEP